MALPQSVIARCEKTLNGRIKNYRTVSGGDINAAYLLETSLGKIFLKLNDIPEALTMFRTEAEGLALLRNTNCLLIPEVLGFDSVEGYAFLLLEFLEKGPPVRDFWDQFGLGLAKIHQNTNPQLGLPTDNFIGSLPQSNRQHNNWCGFYIQERIRPQLEMALQGGLLNKDDDEKFDRLFQRCPELFPEEAPAMIHGDLWNGNYHITVNGLPALIDPSVAFSHREMDLAMSKLFGGFSTRFYEAYHEAFPLQPDWEERIELHQLYYLMVHVNLFGMGYVGSVRRIVGRF